MDRDDLIKHIRWLFISCLVIAFFSRNITSSIEEMIADISIEGDKLISQAIWRKDGIVEFTLEPTDEDDILDLLPYFHELIPQINLSNSLLKPINSVIEEAQLNLDKVNPTTFSFEAGVLGIEGFIVPIDPSYSLLKLLENSTDGFEVDGTFLTYFSLFAPYALAGECKLKYSPDRSEQHLFKCDPKHSFIVKKDHFGYAGEISKDDINEPFDPKTLYVAAKKLINSKVSVPVINAPVGVFDLWLGLTSIAFFIQLYSIATLRRITHQPERETSWMFVSWLHSKPSNFLDKTSLSIECICGVLAYSTLALIPVYVVWSGQEIRLMVDFMYFSYEIIAISIFLSILISCYLFIAMKQQINKREDPTNIQ